MLSIHRFVFGRLICSVFLTVLAASGSADASDAAFIKMLKTDHTLIRFQKVEDLERFSGKLEFGPESGWSLRRVLFGYEEKELLDVTGAKVDAIYQRAQALLGMNRRLKPVTIRLYSDRDQLNSVYYEIFGKRCKERAWYIYKNNTIYINTSDVHDGMLAHEMAHAIVDHYLMMKPPTATAEILARYIDRNLKDTEVKPVEDHLERAAYPSN